MAARNGKCFHTVERHGKGIAHANHLPTVWGQCPRSEEHTSELQSQSNFVCRLLLEKKNLSNRLNPPLAHYIVFARYPRTFHVRSYAPNLTANTICLNRRPVTISQLTQLNSVEIMR